VNTWAVYGTAIQGHPIESKGKEKRKKIVIYTREESRDSGT
jgi:hypothetical protein